MGRSGDPNNNNVQEVSAPNFLHFRETSVLSTNGGMPPRKPKPQNPHAGRHRQRWECSFPNLESARVEEGHALRRLGAHAQRMHSSCLGHTCCRIGVQTVSRILPHTGTHGWSYINIDTGLLQVVCVCVDTWPPAPVITTVPRALNVGTDTIPPSLRSLRA